MTPRPPKLTHEELSRLVAEGKLDPGVLEQTGLRGRKRKPLEHSANFAELKAQAGRECVGCGKVVSYTVECIRCECGPMCVGCYATTPCSKHPDRRHEMKSTGLLVDQIVLCQACKATWRPVLMRHRYGWYTDCPACKRRYIGSDPTDLEGFDADRALEIVKE